jgi:hypothetical protein
MLRTQCSTRDHNHCLPEISLQLEQTYMELSEEKRRQILFHSPAALGCRLYQKHAPATSPRDSKSVAIAQIHTSARGVYKVREDMKDLFSRQLYLEGVCDKGHYMIIAVVRPDLIFSRNANEPETPCLLLVDSLKEFDVHYWGGFERVANNMRT